MKVIRFILLSCILFAAGIAPAQQLTPFVVSTSGGFYNNPSGMLSFTTGEMTAVETYISPSAILTQGFQQTFDLGTFITQPINPNFSFGIYPNPATGHFYLITEAEFNAHVTVRIMDLLEREISFTTYIQQDKINIQPFDLSSSTQGVYLVSITVKDNSSKPAYTYIQKIQIIR